MTIDNTNYWHKRAVNRQFVLHWKHSQECKDPRRQCFMTRDFNLWPSDSKTNGCPGLIVEHFYIKLGDPNGTVLLHLRAHSRGLSVTAVAAVKGLKTLRVDIVTVVVDVGRHVDSALSEVDRNIFEVRVGDQLKLAHVQLLGVWIRPLPAHTQRR